MDISEKNIEDLIFECLSDGNKSKLVNRGLKVFQDFDIFFRQPTLGSYGRADLIGLSYKLYDNCDKTCYKCFRVAVVEIKKGIIGYDAFIQAVRYCKAIESHLKAIDMVGKFKIVLIGTDICKSDFCYLSDFIDEVDVYTVKIDLDKGIVFKKESGYHLSNEKDILISDDAFNYINGYVKGKIREFVFADEPF